MTAVPKWAFTSTKITRQITNKTRVLQLVNQIKQLPIPDSVKIAAFDDLVYLVNNSPEMAQAVQQDVSNITKFGNTLGKPDNMFSWAKSKEGYEFWWKIFRLINS